MGDIDQVYTIMDDERFKSYVINRLTPFPTILAYAGYKGYSYDGKCFCPFHENTDTPAAKLYHDVNGDTLWCFSEQKRYRPTDVINKHMLQKTSIHKVFINIWKQLSIDDQKQLIEDYGKPVSYLPENWEEQKKLLEPFKAGKMSFEQYIVILKAII